MNGAVHPDETSRAQIRQVLEQNFLVEAGAGTGKTSALVERVVSLVLGGRAIERIVAITFTEKAAAELRDRVRRGLEERRDDEALALDQRSLIEQALDSLDRAQISTIHSFCQTVLRHFAPELGIDPAFELQDEVLAERRFEERWRLYLDELGGQPEAVRVVDRVLELGMSTQDIAKLALELWRQPEFGPRLRDRPLVAPAAEWPDLEAMLARLRALGTDSVPDEDRLKPQILALIQLVERLIVAGEERDSLLAGRVSVLNQKYGYGRQDNWGGRDGIGFAREVAQEVSASLNATLEQLRSEALAGLMRYVVDFVNRDALARGREGKLVFDDLILQVRDLLRDNAEARRSVRLQYDCVLIDEFQDTDPLQVEIAWSYAAENGKPDPGRLFLVGDPKQSIYRFRRADMAVYASTRSRVQEAGGLLPQLAMNRRSRSQVVDWVNGVFESVIGTGDQPEVQPPYHEINPDRAIDLRGPGVGWFGGPADRPVREVRRQEASDIAGLVRMAIDQGWEVQDRQTQEVRRASLRDIAVLVPTRSVLGQLERAFVDAGIAYRVEGGSLVYGTQEVRDIINCLAAIDDPADEVAVVGALRSPAYACADTELAAFKLDGGGFNYLNPRLGDWKGRVADGLRNLLAFHNLRKERSLASLVQSYLSDRGLAEITILDQASRDGYRRARFIVEQARAFEADGPESLRALVGWLSRRAGQAVLDNEGAGLDDDEDAVRILTVHGAKGLEFPIAFVAGTAASPPNDRRVFGMDRATGEIAVTIGAESRNARFTLGPVDDINKQERAHLEAERNRLLYVAATRARDHLVVSLHHKQSESRSAAATLLVAGATMGAAALTPPPPAAGRGLNSLASLTVEDAGPLEEFEQNRKYLLARAVRQRYTSATALAGHAERSDETEPWARGRGGTHVGRAVHAALQSVGWDASDAEIAAVARAQAVAEAVPARAEEIAALVRKALASDAAGRARGAPRALREVPFAMPLDGVMVEGFADVVLQRADGLELIDWKTDDVSGAAVRERLREYELQAGLYVLGLEAATGMKVSAITYVFVRPGEELSPGDPPELAARARAAVMGL